MSCRPPVSTLMIGLVVSLLLIGAVPGGVTAAPSPSDADLIVDDDPGSGDCSAVATNDSIQAAVNNASVNDVILVCNGTYTESVVVNKQVTLGARASVTVNGNGADGNGFTVAADGVNIDGFEIRNYGGNATSNNHAGVAIANGVSNVTVSNNIITNIDDQGIVLAGGQHTEIAIQDNTISDVGDFGILARNVTAGTNVEASVIRRNDVDGTASQTVTGNTTRSAILVVAAGGTVDQVGVSTNNVTGSFNDGNLALIEATATNGGSLNGTSLQDNDLTPTSTASGQSGLQVSADTDSSSTTSNVSVSSNSVTGGQGSGVQVATGGGSVTDIVVDSNDVSSTANGIVLGATGGGTIQTVVVNNSSVDSVATAVVTQAAGSGSTLRDVAVARTTIGSSGLTNAGAVVNAGVGDPVGTTATVDNVTYVGNDFSNTGVAGVTATAEGSATLDELNVTLNRLDKTTTAFELRAVDSASVSTLSITENRGDDSTRGFVTTINDSASLTDTNISLNNVSDTSQGGLLLVAGQPAGSGTPSITRLDVDENNASLTASGPAIELRANAGATVDTANVTNSLVENSPTGIRVASGDSATITDLTVNRTAGEANPLGLDVDVTDGATLRRPVFKNTDIAEAGTALAFNTSGTSEDVRISRMNASLSDTALAFEASDGTISGLTVRRVNTTGSANGLAMTLIGSSTVEDATFDIVGFVENTNQAAEIDVGTSSSAGATLRNVSFVSTGINTSAGEGLNVTAVGSSTVDDLSLDTINASYNDGDAVSLTARNTATFRTITLDGVALNESTGSGLVVDASDDTTIENVSLSTINGTRNGQAGLRIDLTNQASVTGLEVDSAGFGNRTATGLDVTLAGSSTLQDVSFDTVGFNDTTTQAATIEVGTSSTAGATLRNLTFSLTGINGSSGDGLSVTAVGGSTVEDLRLDSINASYNTGDAVNLTARNTATFRTITLDGAALNESTASGLVINASDDTTVKNVSLSTINGTRNGQAGLRIDLANQANVTGLEVDTAGFGNRTATGLDVTLAGSSILQDVSFDTVLFNDTTTQAATIEVGTSSGADATLRNLTFSLAGINESSGDGLSVTAVGSSTVEDLSLDSISASYNDGDAVSLTARNTATFRTITLDGAALNESTGSGLVIDASDDTTVKNVSLSTINGTRNGQAGLRIDLANQANVTGLEVDTAGFGNRTATGLDVTLAGSSILQDVSFDTVLFNDTTTQAATIEVGTSSTAGATLRNLTFSLAGINESSGDGLSVTAVGSSTVEDIRFDTVDASGNGGDAVNATVEDTSALRNVSFDTVGLNKSTETGLVVDANDDTTVENVSLSRVEGGSNAVGVEVNATQNAMVDGVKFDLYRAEANTEQGVVLKAGRNGTSDTATVKNVRFDPDAVDPNDTPEVSAAINDTGGPGLALIAGGDGQVKSVRFKTGALSGNDRGVLLRQADSSQVAFRANRTLIESGGQGIVVDAPSGEPRMSVRESLVRNNANEALLVTGPTNPNRTRIQFSFISGNGAGVINENTTSGANVFARLNYWGVNSGPGTEGSASVSAVTDPLTGTPADGAGDTVSERGTSGESNVIFDPWLGKPVCQDPQLTNVSTQFVNFPTVSVPGSSDQVSTAQVAPICAWERSFLPLRTDDTDAATNIELPQTFIELSDGTQAPLNRDKLSVFQQGNTFDIRYRDVTGADTERFSGADAQLVVVRGSSTTSLRGAVNNLEVDRRNGTATLDLNGADITVLDDAEGVGSVDSTGALDVTYTPSRSDQYAFLLFERKFGDGLTVENGNLSLAGGVDLIGVETATVQEKNSSAVPIRSNATYTAGEDVNISVDSRLGSGNTTHQILLYNASTVDAQTVVVSLEEDASKYVTGDADLANVTLETSISGVSGTFLSEENASVQLNVSSSILGLSGPFSVSITEGRTSGNVSTQSLLNETAPELTTVITTPSTRLNASVAVAANTTSSRNITVPTQSDFPAGTYRFVHFAQQRDGFATDGGTVTIEAPPTPTPTPVPPTPTPPPSGPSPGPTTPTPAPPAGGGGGGGQQQQPFFGFRFVDIDVSPREIEAGQTTTVTLTADNNQGIRVQRFITVTVDGEERVTREVRIPPNTERTISIPITLESEGVYEIGVNGDTIGGVVVRPEGVIASEERGIVDAVPSREGVQVRFSRTTIREVTLGRQVSGTVRSEDLRDLPEGIPDPPGQMVQPARITVPPEIEDEQATVRFRLSRSRVEEIGGSSRVRLARWTGTEWQVLETDVHRVRPDVIVFESITPGFSVFAVIAQDETPTPTSPTPTSPTPTSPTPTSPTPTSPTPTSPTPTSPTPTSPTPTPTVSPTASPTQVPSPTSPGTTTGPGGGGGNIGLIIGLIVIVVALAGAVIYVVTQTDVASGPD